MHFHRFFHEDSESVGQINELSRVSMLFPSENVEKRAFCMFSLEYLKIVMYCTNSADRLRFSAKNYGGEYPCISVGIQKCHFRRPV